MCGEHGYRGQIGRDNPGSSPHVRGAPLFSRIKGSCKGIIPACAGSTPQSSVQSTLAWDHPRMCGEHRYKRV